MRTTKKQIFILQSTDYGFQSLMDRHLAEGYYVVPITDIKLPLGNNDFAALLEKEIQEPDETAE